MIRYEGVNPGDMGLLKNGVYFYIVPFQQIDKYNKIIISHVWLMDFAIDVPHFVCMYLLLEALYFQYSKATELWGKCLNNLNFVSCRLIRII
jgi:hypothetical protein